MGVGLAMCLFRETSLKWIPRLPELEANTGITKKENRQGSRYGDCGIHADRGCIKCWKITCLSGKWRCTLLRCSGWELSDIILDHGVFLQLGLDLNTAHYTHASQE